MKKDNEKRPDDLPGQMVFTGKIWDDIWETITDAWVPDRGRRPEPPSRNASESDA